MIVTAEIGNYYSRKRGYTVAKGGQEAKHDENKEERLKIWDESDRMDWIEDRTVSSSTAFERPSENSSVISDPSRLLE